ncbi:bifunctional adenosylcobinamide kinase/adenosylcobinamide-phosphate guanylyltransferase [Azorhizobium oxalatiphilum]|nr:bifunctional adenosylcobinamide kinase/adenosylcobinamide-phosphate guanylyltransferase [Azorhizobium oxalatiphilum]
MSEVTLVLGGARSGKSRHAEQIVERLDSPWAYLATAQAFDAEMEARIALHRARRSESWRTYDAPLDLAGTLDALPPDMPALVDCLTLWLTNHLLAEHDLEAEAARLIAAVLRRSAPVVLVANEVGLGIVPDNALARRFRDAAGRLNQDLAAKADRVVFLVAGLPMVFKDTVVKDR